MTYWLINTETVEAQRVLRETLSPTDLQYVKVFAASVQGAFSQALSALRATGQFQRANRLEWALIERAKAAA